MWPMETDPVITPDGDGRNPDRRASRGRATEELLAVLADRVLVLDGGPAGHQARDLSRADSGAPSTRDATSTRPDAADVVQALHADYFDAGADMVETNTSAQPARARGTGSRSARSSQPRGRRSRARSPSVRTGERPRSSPAPWNDHQVHHGDRASRFRPHTELSRPGDGTLEGERTSSFSRRCRHAQLKSGYRHRAALRRSVAHSVMVSATIEAMGTMLAGQSGGVLLVRDERTVSRSASTAGRPEFMTSTCAASRLSRGPASPVIRTRGCPTRTAATTRPPKARRGNGVHRAGASTSSADARQTRRTSARSPVAQGRRPRRIRARKTLVSASRCSRSTRTTARCSWASGRTSAGAGSSSGSSRRGVRGGRRDRARAVKNGAQIIDVCSGSDRTRRPT